MVDSHEKSHNKAVNSAATAISNVLEPQTEAGFSAETGGFSRADAALPKAEGVLCTVGYYTNVRAEPILRNLE